MKTNVKVCILFFSSSAYLCQPTGGCSVPPDWREKGEDPVPSGGWQDHLRTLPFTLWGKSHLHSYTTEMRESDKGRWPCNHEKTQVQTNRCLQINSDYFLFNSVLTTCIQLNPPSQAHFKSSCHVVILVIWFIMLCWLNYILICIEFYHKNIQIHWILNMMWLDIFTTTCMHPIVFMCKNENIDLRIFKKELFKNYIEEKRQPTVDK